MRPLRLALCWCALLPLARVGEVRGQEEARTVALVNVTLIDGTGAAARPGMTVLVEGETIATVFATGERSLPSSAEVRDMSGRYVVPGLINTHMHLAMLGSTRDSVAERLERMLHAGVTTIREMAGDARLSAGLVRMALIEQAPFPAIHYAVRMAGSTLYEGGSGARDAPGYVPGTAPWAQAITADTDIALAVARAEGTGATGVKIYADLDTAVVRRIVEEAHRQGLNAWAHGTVFPTGPREAVRAGIDGLSHACMLFWGLQADVPRRRVEAQPFDSDPAQLSGEPFQNLVREMRTRGVVMDATARNASRNPGPRRAGCTPELLAATLRAMHEAGVPISTGTDFYIAEGEPDPTLFQEIEYLVESGVLSPLEAITAATLNGARAIGIASSHGTVEPGKAADLVVLSADPTADIGALRDVFAVMKAGRLYERSDYDARGRQGAAEPARPTRDSERAGQPMAAAQHAPDLVARADSLMELGLFDRAIELYERAAALQPDRDVADGELYRTYLALGLVDEGAAWQARARERGGPVPYPGWWHCHLALTAIFRGDRAALEAQTDSLLATASDGAPDSWECAAFNEVLLRQYADARTHLRGTSPWPSPRTCR